MSMLGPLQGLQSSQQQQQQLGQGQQQQQQQGPQNNIPPPPPQNGQDYTLSSVLHFLQTEWRRYERDRNEWEIERAEMRVRRLSCSRGTRAHYFIGTYCAARGRKTLVRERETRFNAPHKNARVCLANGTVSPSFILRIPESPRFLRVFFPSSKQLTSSTSQSAPLKSSGLSQLPLSKDDAQNQKEDSSGSGSPRSDGTSGLPTTLRAVT